jgi:hypothetical protein
MRNFACTRPQVKNFAKSEKFAKIEKKRVYLQPTLDGYERP